MLVRGNGDLGIWQISPVHLGKEQEISSSTLIYRRGLFSIAHFLAVLLSRGRTERRPSYDANRRALPTHDARVSISAFFWAANVVGSSTQKNEQRGTSSNIVPNARSRSLQMGQFIPALRSTKLTSAVPVQKMPPISIELLRRPWRQCSRVKSSRKVNLVACGSADLISEQSAVRASPTAFSAQYPLFSGSAHRRLRVSRFGGRLIAAPVAWMRS